MAKQTKKAAATRKSGRTLSNLRNKNRSMTGTSSTKKIKDGWAVGSHTGKPTHDSELGKARFMATPFSKKSAPKTKEIAKAKKLTKKASDIRKTQAKAEKSKPQPRKLSRKK